MKIQAKLLDIAQRLLNIVYEREGASDRIIKLQVRINTYRAETNIHDKDAVFENGYCQ